MNQRFLVAVLVVVGMSAALARWAIYDETRHRPDAIPLQAQGSGKATSDFVPATVSLPTPPSTRVDVKPQPMPQATPENAATATADEPTYEEDRAALQANPLRPARTR
jgi:cytoskeletal protein RodZ